MSRRKTKQPAPAPLEGPKSAVRKPKSKGSGPRAGVAKGAGPAKSKPRPSPAKGRGAAAPGKRPPPKRKDVEESDDEDDFELAGQSSDEEPAGPPRKAVKAANGAKRPAPAVGSESGSEDEGDDSDGLEVDSDGDDGAISDDSFGDLEGGDEGASDVQSDDGSDGAMDNDEFDEMEMFDDEEGDGDAADDSDMEGSDESGELQTNIAQTQKFVLPSGQEIEKEAIMAPDLALLSTRIQDVIRVLGNFKELRDPERPRSDYVDRLLKDLALYYGYSEYMIEKLFHLFTPPEVSYGPCAAFDIWITHSLVGHPLYRNPGCCVFRSK